MDWVLIFLFGLVLVLGLGIYYFLYRSPMEGNMRKLIAMLLGFGLIMALGSGLFRAFSLWKLQPIEIYRDRVVLPSGVALFRNLDDFGLKGTKRTSIADPNLVRDSMRYLMLFEKGGKTHVLSEGDYPIDSIYAKLEKANE